MESENLASIKTEIMFFMDKMFQFSFIYLGAIFASIAGTNLGLYNILSSNLNVPKSALLLLAILALNFIYLILSLSCSFAILKRGLFILQKRKKDSTHENILIDWEEFVRFKRFNLSTVTWNLDNFYVIILISICYLFSFYLIIWGICTFYCENAYMLWALIFVALFYLLLIFVFRALYHLNTHCRAIIKNSTH